MFERALVPSMAHTVKPPSVHSTFTWIIRPRGDTFQGTVYTDGSRLDGPDDLLARNGWAFVVFNEDGEMIAAANGVPPDWITDIPGAEAWAVIQAAMRAEPECTYMVDCEPCVKAFHMGKPAACAANRPLARVNGMMHDALDDTPSQAMIWMPSHATEADLGTICRGDGFLLTLQDLDGNDAADRLAKRAVNFHRVPFMVRKAIEAHDQLTTDNAVWIARATVLANRQQQHPLRDTEACRE